LKHIGQQEIVHSISGKLDALSKLLLLCPYNLQGQFQGKLQPVSYKSIQAVQVICPQIAECETTTCNPQSLLQNTRLRDVPRVTLLKGTTIHENVQVLTGYCPTCQTIYLADHECAQGDNRKTRVYLNDAKYLKVGQSLWVDRVFSSTVLNGMYSFHASASAFMEFWNNSFHSEHVLKISCWKVWQAFVQESIRSIAATSNINVELQDGLAIDDVTKEAFSLLGENGIINAADQHACKECTQPYKHTADVLPGVDQSNQNSDDNMDIDQVFVKMVVVDGIVFGPQHCAYENCTSDLANYRGGSFCALHENQWGARCHMCNCINQKVEGTQACAEH